MSKLYTEEQLSNRFDEDLIWRRKELSDIKLAIRNADEHARAALLRALIAMCYAHWEGYVKVCASCFFEFMTSRRKPYSTLARQFYVNGFIVRLNSLYQSRLSLASRCELVNDILDIGEKRFVAIKAELIDTKSNLNTDVIKDICTVCGVDGSFFEEKRTFIDTIILKRRNAIAHGQYEFIDQSQVDQIIDDILGLMNHFRGLLENSVYTQAFLAA